MSVSLNAVKQTFNLKEYSLSQATLEQVGFHWTSEHHPDDLCVNQSFRNTLTFLYLFYFLLLRYS